MALFWVEFISSGSALDSVGVSGKAEKEGEAARDDDEEERKERREDGFSMERKEGGLWDKSNLGRLMSSDMPLFI
eukprot:CAMPEP_0175082424 /NCGR_PEP_ID=MMETSP0052_2-20121109/26746_1 /TAXON_ID=51329 ORGANISM="Polytomella parva, Strain SAG 63-3" /NCGR_SAMPLE_ID=MMETSP0052_2 /ASSEMBLY_ACC=CAM_ASM_000194 /LENGTH=74 /DNA_ID=CAMNT_0016353615 /DNA_START=149 /DNA_END=373 /DNA_ORIENTATION=-